RVPRVVGEVAHAFEGRPEILEVVRAQLLERVAAREAVEQPLLEVQRDLGLAVLLRDQELFVEAPAARVERARERRIRREEVVDLVRHLERVEVSEQILEPRELHGRQWRVAASSVAFGSMPCERSSRAARKLPVLSHTS